MRKLYRFLISTYSLITAILALVMFGLVVSNNFIESFLKVFTYIHKNTTLYYLVVVLLIAIFGSAVFCLSYAIRTGRLSQTRLKKTDIGFIEIGVDALESIALNSARAAQAGIKTAKARVFAATGSEVKVELTVVLYSDIEIPAQMAKIQDRIKKDIERYTGIPVAGVSVRVSRVEVVGAKVER